MRSRTAYAPLPESWEEIAEFVFVVLIVGFVCGYLGFVLGCLSVVR